MQIADPIRWRNDEDQDDNRQDDDACQKQQLIDDEGFVDIHDDDGTKHGDNGSDENCYQCAFKRDTLLGRFSVVCGMFHDKVFSVVQ